MRVNRVTAGIRCVAVLLAVAAALSFAVPGSSARQARADSSGLTVNLNFERKTEVEGTSYKLGHAKVSGGSAIYVVVEVNNGWFMTPASLPTSWSSLPESGVGLDANGAFASEVKPGSNYKYTAFGCTKNGGSSVTAQDLQQYLTGLRFYPGGAGSQTVSVSTVSETLEVKDNSEDSENGERSGNKSKKTILFGGHVYTFMTDGSSTFDGAYGGARKLSLDGVNGRLMTIESPEEHNLIYKLFNGDGGWIGGVRFFDSLDSGTSGGITLNCRGPDWYWVTGPNTGLRFWGADGPIPGVYANWKNGQPDSSAGSCYLQYGLMTDSGAWNALTSNSSGHEHNTNTRGYYVEFDGTGSKVKRVTGTAKTASVTYDLLDVTASNMNSRVLQGMPFETTLHPEGGRQLDAASLKVTVGGRPLERGKGFNFNGGTGRLHIPGEHVTGDVTVTAKAKRFVDLVDRWTSQTLVRLQLGYGEMLDVTLLDTHVGANPGYTLVGYTMRDGSKWDFATPVTQDLTLMPLWTLNAPTVSIWPPFPRLDRRDATVMLHASSKVDMVPHATFTYQWSKDGQPLDGGVNGVLSVGEPGVYMVQVTATDPRTGLTSMAQDAVTVAAPQRHTVTVQGKGGFSSLMERLTVTNGDKLSKSELDERANRAGYRIVGYVKPDGTPWSFDAEVLASLTLHPQYEMIPPTLKATARPAKLVSVGDKSTLSASAMSQIDGVTFVYRWSRGGKSVGVGESLVTGEPGVYMVEVTATDPNTGMSATNKAFVTLEAPSKHRVTVRERDGSKVYLTLDVPNGGLLGMSTLVGVSRNGHAPVGWITSDGAKFDPAKDRITGQLTIHPQWRPVVRLGKPAKPAVTLVDTGLAVAVPVVTLALLVAAAGALAALRRRRGR